MKITYLMIATYILYCIKIGTKPCKYFQFNSPYFDAKEGIFSKISIDQLIPEKWRLQQFYDNGIREPNSYPAFVKPEWGQNAKGIFKVESAAQLKEVREKVESARVKYLIQAGAAESREFEIFTMRHHEDKNRYAILTVTEAVNHDEQNPINSIYNSQTRYCEITEQLSSDDKDQLWDGINQIGEFYISRMSARANSLEDLISGYFHIIEINLFLPMPINMLDAKYSWSDIQRTVRRYMLCMAKLTKTRDKTRKEKPVFTKIMLYDRESRVLNYLRAKI